MGLVFKLFMVLKTGGQDMWDGTLLGLEQIPNKN